MLCGSWPGRQRAASPLTDVVRGATSRIRDYRRVSVHGRVDIAVVSRAVEPVVLAVAELLDNAARHSQPNTNVEVNFQPVHNGACVVIDDAGVGMDGLGGRSGPPGCCPASGAVDVTRLGDPPQFGFAVIGVLAPRYGFSVSVDTRSPYGGVRAVAVPAHRAAHHTRGAPPPLRGRPYDPRPLPRAYPPVPPDRRRATPQAPAEATPARPARTVRPQPPPARARRRRGGASPRPRAVCPRRRRQATAAPPADGGPSASGQGPGAPEPTRVATGPLAETA